MERRSGAKDIVWFLLSDGRAGVGRAMMRADRRDVGRFGMTPTRPQDVVLAAPGPPCRTQPVAGKEDYIIVVTSLSRATLGQSTSGTRRDAASALRCLADVIWPRCEVAGLGR